MNENITDGWMYTYIMVPKQIITKENCKFILQNVGLKIIKYIEKNKMIIPEDDFIALVGVKFTALKDYEKREFTTEKDPNANTTFIADI